GRRKKKPTKDAKKQSREKTRRKLGMKQTEGSRHDLTKLIFIAGIHVGDAFRIAVRRGLSVMINPPDDDYIAANPRSLSLNNRAADGGHVTFHRTFDNHVSAKGDRAFFDGAGDPD